MTQVNEGCLLCDGNGKYVGLNGQQFDCLHEDDEQGEEQ